MPSWLCKLFRFLLNVAEITIETIASAIKTVGNAVWDVLESVVEGVGGVLDGIFSSPTLLLGIGAVALFFLLKGKDDDEKVQQPNTLSLIREAQAEVNPYG